MELSDLATIKVSMCFFSFFVFSFLSPLQLTVSPNDFDHAIDSKYTYIATYVPARLEFLNGRTHEVVENVGIKIRGSYSRRLAKKGWCVNVLRGRK